MLYLADGTHGSMGLAVDLQRKPFFYIFLFIKYGSDARWNTELNSNNSTSQITLKHLRNYSLLLTTHRTIFIMDYFSTFHYLVSDCNEA